MAKISPGTMTVAIFAILLGLAGAYTVRQYLEQKPVPVAEATEAPRSENIFVPVAARKIQVGQELSLSDIVVRSFTQEEFKKSQFSKVSFMPDTDQIIGQVVAIELEEGAVFKPNSFFPDSMGPGISANLKPGFRAVTIPIKNIGAVQGFARPGSHVDVLFRATHTDQTPEITVNLLEDIEVLALGAAIIPDQVVSLDDRGRQDGTVTLSVLPEEATALKVVEGRGELSLVLRNPQENQQLQSVSIKNSAMTLSQLLGIQEQQKPKQVEIYRAGQKQTVTFADSSNHSQLNKLIQEPVVEQPQEILPARTAGQSVTQADTVRGLK
ncbi:MAG: Flp pilus assembly protein CpaB [Planctomycetaceae bacterium]|nr:Flp pilus assembly protein CpaB [Planctomycetaceae bacterium]